MANSWYVYNGFGDPFIPASYQRLVVGVGCLDGCKVCAVYILGSVSSAPANPFSDNILNYLAAGLGSLTRQPVGIGIKPYVYLRNC